jgi:glycine oxidase
MNDMKVLIVGAGVIGLSSALELASRGADVTVLDQGRASHESTWAGGGILSPLLPWHYGAAVNALSEYSRGLFFDWCARLQALSGHDPELIKSGMLVLPPVDEAEAEKSEAEAATWCEAHGWSYARCSSRDFLPCAPQVDALWLPGVFQARNPRLGRALLGAAKAAGVKIVEHARVKNLVTLGGRVNGVQTEHARYAADIVVLAAGAWSASIAGLEVLQKNVFPVRGQMLLFKAEPGLLSSIVLHNGRYLIPRVDGHILAGSTLEDVGFDKETTAEAKIQIMEFAMGLLPGLDELLLAQQWSGLRPGSPDNVPLIGPHAELDNLFLNTGHFRYGVTMAPGSAKLLASLIFGETTPIDASPYRMQH